jgi:hypothetical protein
VLFGAFCPGSKIHCNSGSHAGCRHIWPASYSVITSPVVLFGYQH